MALIKKVATAGTNDVSGLKSSRYEKLQVSYGVVPGTSFVGTGAVSGKTLTITAAFAGTVSISGTTLTLNTVSSGKLVLGAPVVGTGIAAGTYITSTPTSGGNDPGVTTCSVSVSQTVGPVAATLGSLAVGTVINNTPLVNGSRAYITALGTGTGQAGTYTLSADCGTIGSANIYGGAYGLGETLIFSDVPSQDIIKAVIVAHADGQPSALDIYPASNKSGVFSLAIPNTVTYPVKLSYVIEYIRGGGRVGSTSEGSEGQLLSVAVTSAGSLDEIQIADTE